MTALNPFSSSFQKLPLSIQRLVRFGIERVDPEKVILFGSRARGDHRENSDYDIAFVKNSVPSEWGRFISEFLEDAITLHKVDLLVYEDAATDYRDNIDREGVILYER